MVKCQFEQKCLEMSVKFSVWRDVEDCFMSGECWGGVVDNSAAFYCDTVRHFGTMCLVACRC